MNLQRWTRPSLIDFEVIVKRPDYVDTLFLEIGPGCDIFPESGIAVSVVADHFSCVGLFPLRRRNLRWFAVPLLRQLDQFIDEDFFDGVERFGATVTLVF